MRGAFVDQGGLFSYIAPEARVSTSADTFADTLRRALAAPKPSEAKHPPNARRAVVARPSDRKTYR